MSKSMLDPIVRALVGVDAKHHGVVLDIANKLGGDNADEYRKRLAGVLREPIVPPPPIDSIIRIDSSVRPVYPDWMDQAYINTPEFLALERSGLSDYDLAKIVQWLHEGQKNGGRVTGNRIFDHLKASDMLEGCLGLADLQAIQKLGLENFRKYFAGKAVFGWKSVVRHRDGDLVVPYLIEGGVQVKLNWNWLDNDFNENNPALRFAPLFISRSVSC